MNKFRTAPWIAIVGLLIGAISPVLAADNVTVALAPFAQAIPSGAEIVSVRHFDSEGTPSYSSPAIIALEADKDNSRQILALIRTGSDTPEKTKLWIAVIDGETYQRLEVLALPGTYLSQSTQQEEAFRVGKYLEQNQSYVLIATSDGASIGAVASLVYQDKASGKWKVVSCPDRFHHHKFITNGIHIVNDKTNNQADLIIQSTKDGKVAILPR